MKKALVVILGVLMAVMFAAESYAEITVGGTIDVRGRWRENNTDLSNDNNPDTGAHSDSTAFWQEKVNIWVDAKIAEGLKGYVELQSGMAGSSKGWVYWGTARASTDAAANSVVNENRGLAFMEIRYAYIDFMIPGVPVGIKIGHMPIVVGHSIWANTSIWGSDGLMIYAVPIKELMIALGTLKGYEASPGTNVDRSDMDMYGLHVLYTFMPKNTVGFNANYLLQTGNAGTFPGSVYDMKIWNFMVTADGALDFGLGYKFEVDKQFGGYNTEDPLATGYPTGAYKEYSTTGLAFLLGVDFQIEKIAKVGMDIAYGSGDKCEEWGPAPATGVNACDNSGDKLEGYLNFNDYAYTMIYEDIVRQKSGVSTWASIADFGLYNTMYLKVGGSVTPLKDMSIGLDFYYLRAVQPYYEGQSSNLGWEADLNFGYNIYKNLKWTFLAGYFSPGKHYKVIGDLPAGTAKDSIKDDAAWAFEQKLSLKF